MVGKRRMGGRVPSLLPAIVVGAAAAALAQDAVPARTPVLTLEEVVDSVLRHYPEIDEAIQAFEEAEALLLARRGGFDPSLSGRALAFPVGPYSDTRIDVEFEQPTRLWGTRLFAEWRREGPDVMPFRTRFYDTNELGSYRAGVAVPLWRGGPIDRARADLAQARQQTSIARLGIDGARIEFVRLAAHRYWAWVASGRRLEVARNLLSIARDRDAQLRERVARGDIAEFERVDNERALVQRQGQVVAAERAVENTAIMLSLFLRDGSGAPVVPDTARLPGDFPEPQPPEEVLSVPALEAVMLRRPDLARLQALRAKQEVEIAWAHNQRAPAVDLTVAGASQFGDGPAVRREPVVETGLRVGIPILNRAAIGRDRAARAVIAQIDARLELQRDRVVVEVRDAQSAVRAAYQQVGLARQEVRLARRLEEGERTRFQLGDSTLLFVNLREQQSAEAALREVDALAEYHRARASFRAALALPQPTQPDGSGD